MKHKLLLLYAWFIWAITFFLPDIPFIMRFRGFLYGAAMKQCGKNLQISSGARLYCLNNIKCGNHIYIATNVVLNAGTEIELQDEVMIGIGSVIVSGNHSLFKNSYRFAAAIREPVIVGKGSWIAGNALVTAGATLPESSMLAGGAVLNKKFSKPGIYGGVPAKFIANSIEVE